MDYPKVKPCLDTSEYDLIEELYLPCLKWADRFDRGVGFFTTGWITYNVTGLSNFASRGGKMRLITSPILSNEDTDAIINSEGNNGEAFKRLEAALIDNVRVLEAEMKADVSNAFSWMIYDGIIDLRFAIPCEKLEDGDFHDKFGIFYKGEDRISFSGSINDSKHGYQNYESIKVFKTWAGTGEYVESDINRFEKIWNSKDKNLRIFTVPTAVKERIFQLRTSNRPYKKHDSASNRWVHQDMAVEKFIEKEHDFIEIDNIDRYIKLKERSGASQGQTLGIAYCFLGTLFEDSELEFPFIIDSPTGSMDFDKREAVADIIPKVFNQMISFVQSAEVKRFADRFYDNPDAQYLTIVVSPSSGMVEVHEGIDFFDSYQQKHKGDEK